LNDCLHIHIEDVELCLTEGLSLPGNYKVDIDEDGLLRMDKSALYEALGKGVSAAILKPDEARQKLGLPPVEGGDSPYLQQQNFSLAALAKRDALADPFGVAQKPAAPASPAQLPESTDVESAAKAAELLDYISRGLTCST
jgi:phage portal protein BeeE